MFLSQIKKNQIIEKSRNRRNLIHVHKQLIDWVISVRWTTFNLNLYLFCFNVNLLKTTNGSHFQKLTPLSMRVTHLFNILLKNHFSSTNANKPQKIFFEMPQISYFPTQRSSETDRNKHVLYGVFRSQSNKKHKQKKS